MSGEEFVMAARRWIGTPYVHQADVRGAGTDCLGLLRGVWREVLGQEPETVPAYTADWSEPSGDEVLMRAADRWLLRQSGGEPGSGDVLLFRMRSSGVAKHLGIVSGPGRFIHAYTGHGVTESPLSAPWQSRIAARYAFPERI
ncbi:NlpC/P60 family protein [Falsirhodobacter sp. alg1]|uniref:NlpC/P60 family protein n=1 Tax=Falsirhodobacter sp. alg1 TaxID=1472418 RepID=UPI0005ED710A|nr:NlpC/P60 family protein [Falsirhodobacter sp. alg1]